MFDIFHTVSGLGLHDGGPSRSVPAIADAQVDFGCNVTVVDTAFNPLCENGIPLKANFIGIEQVWSFSRRFAAVLKERSIGKRSVVHDHGLWCTGNYSVWKTSQTLRRCRIVSPRGMLSPWALKRNRFSKRIVWHLWQRKALSQATAFHATSEEEAVDIRNLGFTQPIAMVPNGVTLPASLPQRGKRTDKRTALFLSRIHPKKGLLNLLQAWQHAGIGHEWELVIAGPDEGGHKAEVRSMAEKLGLLNSVHFREELGDDVKWQAYVDADLFVLPSLSENFGIVVAEAMIAGLPVLTTTATPWQCLPENRLGWCVDPDVPSLTRALRQSTALDPSELREMGRAAARFASSKYNWGYAAEALVRFLEELVPEHS